MSGSTIEMENRATTLISVLTKIPRACFWMIALVMALTETEPPHRAVDRRTGRRGPCARLGRATLMKDWLGGLFLSWKISFASAIP